MPFIIQNEWFTREQVRDNPDIYFVFGDNEQRFGTGGQAKACRDEPNCIGIRTKRWPSNHPDSFWTDDNLKFNIMMLNEDFMIIKNLLKQGKTVIFPAAGVGTGLANLKNNAPVTLKYIEDWMNVLRMNYSE